MTEFSAVKLASLNKICKNKLLYETLNQTVLSITKIKHEASLLAAYHILKNDQTFF